MWPSLRRSMRRSLTRLPLRTPAPKFTSGHGDQRSTVRPKDLPRFHPNSGNSPCWGRLYDLKTHVLNHVRSVRGSVQCCYRPHCHLRVRDWLKRFRHSFENVHRPQRRGARADCSSCTMSSPCRLIIEAFDGAFRISAPIGCDGCHRTSSHRRPPPRTDADVK